MISLTISFGTVFVMTFIVLGFDFYAAFVILVTIFMIVTDIGGLMYFWNINLNGVSLVNLVVVSSLNLENQ